MVGFFVKLSQKINQPVKTSFHVRHPQFLCQPYYVTKHHYEKQARNILLLPVRNLYVRQSHLDV